jgi:TRAP-type uncharacterized transport system substrate-binding protein
VVRLDSTRCGEGKPMFRLSWSSLLKGLAAILCIVGVVSLALLYFIPAPPSKISIASGTESGSYVVLAGRYRKYLHARMWS